MYLVSIEVKIEEFVSHNHVKKNISNNNNNNNSL